MHRGSHLQYLQVIEHLYFANTRLVAIYSLDLSSSFVSPQPAEVENFTHLCDVSHHLRQEHAENEHNRTHTKREHWETTAVKNAVYDWIYLLWLFFVGGANRVGHGWGVAEPFSKWGGTTPSQKMYKNFVAWIGNCDVTSIEIWRH